MENIISEVGVLGNVLKYKKKKSHERLLLFFRKLPVTCKSCCKTGFPKK